MKAMGRFKRGSAPAKPKMPAKKPKLRGGLRGGRPSAGGATPGKPGGYTPMPMKPGMKKKPMMPMPGMGKPARRTTRKR